MALQDPPKDDLGSAVIVPAAESNRQPPEGVTPEQEKQFYTAAGQQFHLAHNQQNLGFLGKLFGNGSAASTNIAGMVIILSFIFLAGSYFLASSPEVNNLRAILAGLISSALSFIFGAATKK